MELQGGVSGVLLQSVTEAKVFFKRWYEQAVAVGKQRKHLTAVANQLQSRIWMDSWLTSITYNAVAERD